MNMGTSWGNGYTEYNRGWQNAGFAFEGKEIARTDGDTVIAYDKRLEALVNRIA